MFSLTHFRRTPESLMKRLGMNFASETRYHDISMVVCYHAARWVGRGWM